MGSIATAITGAVIGATALIGMYQLRQLREQRRDTGAIELMRSLQDTTFARAFLLILSLPQAVSAENIRARDPELEEAAGILAFRFETFGLLVYRGTISFEVVDDLMRGVVVGAWHRLKDLTLRTREEKDWPMYCEWFQWLAEQFEASGSLDRAPAHIRLKDWRPKRRASVTR